VITSQGAVYVFLLYVTQFVWNVLAAIFGATLDPKMLRKAEATV